MGNTQSGKQDIDSQIIEKARLLDLLPGLVAYFDCDLLFRYANRRYLEWRGVDAHAIIGRHCQDIVGKTNFIAVRKWLREAVNGIPALFEYDLITSGERRRVQCEYVPDFDAEGRVCGVLALVTDLTQRQEISQRIAESEALFDDAFSNSPIGMALVDTDGRLIRANDNFCSMLARSVDELTNMNFAEITHPEDIDADLTLFRQVLAGNRDGYKIDKRYIRPDGGIVESTLTVTAMRNAAGEIVRFISQIEDITQQRQAQRRLLETHAELSLAMELVSGGFWHMDLVSGVFRTSERLAEFIDGAGAQPLDLATYVTRINPDDRSAEELRALREGVIDRIRSEYRLMTFSGERWVRCDRKLFRDAEGRPAKIVGMAIDITRERDQLHRSQEQADTDILTGLFNRRGFETRFGQEPVASRCGLLIIDLDGFKQVNDRLGHDAGDQVLVEVATRLRASLREGDIVARHGGDEFVTVLVDRDERLNQIVAERIRASVGAPIMVNGHAVVVGCSIGSVWLPAWPVDLRPSLARADAALYQAKAAGKNTWRSA